MASPTLALPQTVEECHAMILRLLPLVEEVERLRARVEELERRLNQTSQNSSKPPSSNPPSVKLPPKKKPSGRKRGGQPGHEGHHRALLPPEEVDEVVDHWPTQCEHCHGELPSSVRIEVGEPERHQQTELPETPARVIEHRAHTQQCRRCGHATSAEIPAEARPTFGARLTAAVALLTGACRMSTRMVEEVLRDLFDVRISLGAVVTCERTASEAVAPAVEEARAFVQDQATAHADETSWREAGCRAWLWVLATPLVVVFLIHARRNRKAARDLLGHFAGTLGSDRWPAYFVHKGLRQICWAHLARDFQALSEFRGKVGRIGKELTRHYRTIFRWWHRVRDGTLSRADFQRRMKRVRTRVETLLAQGVVAAQSRASGMCWDIAGKHGDALWTFVDVEGIEPTNNRAERALRHAVMWRKTSYGTQSEAGSRFAERMLTVRASLRAQRRNVLDYVTQAVEASLRGHAVPSLLPATASDNPAALPMAA
ncbi:MAG: IS66 family transposase [Chloroflexi bacterium]|nr:IS66 family transposase [Chloroflexota bacterium]